MSASAEFVTLYRRELAGMEYLAKLDPDRWRRNGFLAGWAATKARLGAFAEAFQRLQDLYDRDEIYKEDYEGWYSVSDERFYTEKELVDGKSPEGKDVEKITEANYFFRMGKYRDWLVEYIEANPDFIQPDFRRNETLGFLNKQELGDLCISRPSRAFPGASSCPSTRIT